jgi:two-component system sensor histidine kinase KdpD
MGYPIGAAGVALTTAALLPFRDRINTTPVALAFLLVVLVTAAGFGSGPAVAASIASMFSFNYLFLPPYNTLRIADPQNWTALAAFLITALIAGTLSAKAARRAAEAERRQEENEHLYDQLRRMFEKAGYAEAMKQSERLKSALLDAVTHDLRTPLTSVKAAVTTLLAGGAESRTAFELDEEGRREMLEVINTEIDRLNHHLEGLIEIAKIEAGALQPRRAWINLEEIVSISLTRASGATAHHRVRSELEEGLPPLRVDEKSIAEVVYLLLENAAKYAPPGTEILVTAKSMGPESVLLSVEDQGIGIPVELRERVFDKFFRASVETNVPARAAGLGMGLAIARGLVEAHGGRIWVEDASRGRGVRVSFTIPLQAD